MVTLHFRSAARTEHGKRALIATLMLATALGIAGCGGGGGGGGAGKGSTPGTSGNGTGTGPTTAPSPTYTVSLSAASLAFPAVTAGSVSGAQTVTLTNTGTGTVTISGVTIAGANAGNFTETNNCAATLAPAASCSISIKFASSMAGSSSAVLTIADSAAGASQTVALSGTAIAPTTVSLSTHAIAFPALTAGKSSSPQTVTINNTGTAVLSLADIAITGAGANFFSKTTTCGATVAVAASCKVTITFAPNTPGSYTASLNFTDNAADSPQSVALSASANPAALTIDTANANDWKISNGVLSLDWNSTSGRIFHIFLAGHPDDLVDNTSGLAGIYMDNAGVGSGTTTATFTNAGTYLDWSITTASNAANAYTYTEHFVITPNDPGIHVYFVADHATTDIAGDIGQIQWVYRSNLNDFTNTYTVNGDLSNPGPVIVPLPSAAEDFSTDPGREVENAVVDLHGFTDLPAGFTRKFYTKYDYASYNYLHQAHGTFGTNSSGVTFGVWAYFPSNESLVGGPTKQNLIFTGNLLMLEPYSNHLDNNLSLSTPAGVASSRLFGPFYIRFNTLGQAYNTAGNTLKTPADMYQDALQAGASFVPFYDTEQQLLASGYVASTARGAVSVQINGATGAPHTAWAVLSDPNTNFQFSSQGHQYWLDISGTGTAHFTDVIPGTYRLSVYVLGHWGELRQDNVVVVADQTTTLPTATWVAENFAGAPVFTIGTADRSAHEFLHGHDAAGHDDREYSGAWNYWLDFESNQGAVIYNATAGPAGPATNDLDQWNYNHWGTFDPGLYGGFYNPSDDTTDGYTYIVPSYVATPASTGVPSWKVHFATPASQTGATASNYVVLSVALACVQGSYVANLNGQSLTWHELNPSDCMVRSGLSGYTQWVAFQWNSSVLKPAGQDNVLAVSASQSNGVSEDALRLELTNTSADPAVRGWHDYEYIYQNTDTPANDAIANP